jgi:hypothetical protein
VSPSTCYVPLFPLAIRAGLGWLPGVPVTLGARGEGAGVEGEADDEEVVGSKGSWKIVPQEMRNL